MAITRLTLAENRENEYTARLERINEKIKGYQRSLEELGFTTDCQGILANFEAAQELIAEKGNVILRIIRFLTGGEEFLVTVKSGNYKKNVIVPPDFDAAVNIAEMLRKGIR